MSDTPLTSKKLFRITQTRCGCHPETCCCPDFTVLCGDEVVCGGSDRESMQALVDAANRAADEPSAGVKCTHCNGTGYGEPIYDEQDGWIDEVSCETCNGSGRITA